MFDSSIPSKVIRLKVDDFAYKSGMLVASATLLSNSMQYLGTYNHPGMWSEKTAKAIRTLLDCIEADMAMEHFGEGATAIIEPGSDYEEATVHEHIEYLPGEDIDIESEF